MGKIYDGVNIIAQVGTYRGTIGIKAAGEKGKAGEGKKIRNGDLRSLRIIVGCPELLELCWFISSLRAGCATLGLWVGRDARSTYKTDIGIRRGKMPRLQGVVVLRNGARCPTYGYNTRNAT